MGKVFCHFCKVRIGNDDTKFTRFNLAAFNANIPETMTSESRMCVKCFSEKKTIPVVKKEPQVFKKKSLFR